MDEERAAEETLFVWRSIKEASVDVEYVTDTNSVTSYILNVELFGVVHHYIGSYSIHYKGGKRIGQWDLEYYDTDDNEPANLKERVTINSEEDFRTIVGEHLVDVIQNNSQEKTK